MIACKAEGVWFTYSQRNNWVLKGIDLEVPQGGFLTILGPSGSGKTTLVKVLAGLLPPTQGQVELLGQRLNSHAPLSIRRQVGYIPQQLGLVRNMTALENVLLGMLGQMSGPGPLLGLFPKQVVERARAYLASLGIESKAGEKVHRLSGGERQRVAIARTLLQGPKIVFADEFVSDLDLPRAAQVLEDIRQLGQREGIALVINLHEVPLVQELGDQVLILKEGSIVYRGLAQDITLSLVREVMA